MRGGELSAQKYQTFDCFLHILIIENQSEGVDTISLNVKPGHYKESTLVDRICTDAQKRSYQKNNRFSSNKQRDMFLERLSRYCTFEINESTRKYIVHKMYEYPKTAAEEKIHKGIYQYLAPLILNKLLDNGGDRSILFSSYSLAAECFMVNRNYPFMKFNPKAVEADMDIPENRVSEYFNKSANRIDYYIRQCLKYLESMNCVMYNEPHLIKTFDQEIHFDSEIETVVHHRKISDLHIATKEEMDTYTEAVEIACERAGVYNKRDKWYGKAARLYKTELDKLLKSRKIRCIYKGFAVWKVNTNRCQQVFDSFMDRPILDYQRGIGCILKAIIDGNAEKRSLQDTQYIEHFRELSELTLLYDAPDIRPLLPSAKSYQDRLVQEAMNMDNVIIEH